MAMIPPPEGLSAEDYDAIEAAVVETVRGRWFLAEYTRRSRVDEMRQMLDGLAKLEQTVREQQLPNDPSIRLLVQRLRDVSQTLEILAGNMRDDGIGEHYCRDVETQARAVGGLLRGAPRARGRRRPRPTLSPAFRGRPNRCRRRWRAIQPTACGAQSPPRRAANLAL